ncbi:hypothetical protein ACI7YQ_13365 [Alteromonas marina]|uniref:hypothetical protein n=1 Tax=unclassified Alteromonas TaxID=2614992 RepID=UPI0012E6C2E7|nr:hypothetical protein [Alteromonas sp. KUL150]GFD74409.1 hypothetical protein KUL113_38290 [Tenacibaculum sp. KUL113]GFD86953.1 hypothetical protein KUL150_30120 [Alteromonas sp. KUL150]
MPKKLDKYLEEGVMYHAFSDLSGVTFYSTISNEIFVAAVSESDLLSAFHLKSDMTADVSNVASVLVKQGFIKTEWH